MWDKGGYYYKPEVTPATLTLKQLTYLVDFNLAMISIVEPKFNQLVTDIPPYNMENAEMIQFCTYCFGNEGWLQAFQLKQLRKKQQAEHLRKTYMPPVDKLKAEYGNQDIISNLDLESEAGIAV